jgi:TolB protein
VFSSDGARMAFERPRHGIFTARLDGSRPPAPVPGTENSYAPAWSPGRGRLAFHTFPPGPSVAADIYTARPNGSELQRLTSTGHSFSPIWAADGRIAFTWEGANPGVFVMNADGSGRTRVTRAPGPHSAEDPQDGALDIAESWSPDSKRIAFVRIRRDNRRRVYVVRPSGQGLRRLARGAAFAAWAPNGKRIAVAPRHGRRIHTVRPDGTHRRRIATEPRHGAAQCDNDDSSNLSDEIGFGGLDWQPLRP